MPTSSPLAIRTYKFDGVWVFDAPEHGLVREPFVCGMSEIIDVLAIDIANQAQGVLLHFSDRPFAGHESHLSRLHEEHGGYWYEDENLEMRGWLCPAALHYYPGGHPPDLYLLVSAV